MNFNFNQTAGISQNNRKQLLEGNKIHDVQFKGCESRDFESAQGELFKVIDIKFENADGYFTHTIFEPKERDYEQQDSPFGTKNPSNVQNMMLLCKHLIDAVNPKLAKEIDDGTANLNAESWDALRKLIVEATKPGIDKQLKIKLLKNKKGEAIFPGFIAAYNREGGLYIRTNFIGEKIFFSPKELSSISKATTATPTKMETVTDPFKDFGGSTTTTPDSIADLDFNL